MVDNLATYCIRDSATVKLNFVLIYFRVLTEDTQSAVEAEKIRLGKNQKLLDTLLEQGISALPCFIEALKGPFCNYESMAEELLKDYNNRLHRSEELVEPEDAEKEDPQAKI